MLKPNVFVKRRQQQRQTLIRHYKHCGHINEWREVPPKSLNKQLITSEKIPQTFTL